MSKTPAEDQTDALSEIRFWTITKWLLLLPWIAALVATALTGSDRWLHVSLACSILVIWANAIATQARVKLGEANLRSIAELIDRPTR